MSKKRVHIVGAGLAGTEAAWFLAERGFHVLIHEMRPIKSTEAHHTGQFAELVCSNSLKSKVSNSAPGIMKAEMNQVGSLILGAAELSAVPGGDALTVDRNQFAEYITQTLRQHSNIEIVNEEVTQPFTDGPTLIATGPLTSEGLSHWISKETGAEDLYFYDAIAPIVEASTIDYDKVFLANRYGKGGEEAYLNCPMTEQEYYSFIDALSQGQQVTPKSFEKEKFFAGCQPIEAIAATGRESLRFGPMKPVGLDDPRTGKRPYAVIQLRPENRAKTAYNLVGFQTKLKWGDQAKIFKTIPGLEHAEFLRMGSIHRNTYVNGPRVLRPDLSLKGHPTVYFAGQITGVEGYLESAACGMMSGMFIAQRLLGLPHDAPPANTALGVLLRHVVAGDEDHYQPNNIQFGLFDPNHFDGLVGLKKDLVRDGIARQAPLAFGHWWLQQSQLQIATSNHGIPKKENTTE